MSLTITATITVADDEAYTAREQAILSAIAAHPSNGTAAVTPAAAPAEKIPAGVAADARIAEAKAKAAADGVAAREKAAAAAKAKAAAEAKAAAAAAEAAAAEEPDAAPETAEDDLVGSDTTYTIADAVAAATKLVSGGNSAAVKAALSGTSAKKVSELKGDDITTFMTALEA